MRNIIVYDHNQTENDDENEEKKDELYIKYGDKTWEPSFWPNNLWKWSDVKNFSNITIKELKEHGLGGIYPTLTDFFKDVIRMGLQHYQINADDNINNDFTSEQESRRKKA